MRFSLAWLWPLLEHTVAASFPAQRGERETQGIRVWLFLLAVFLNNRKSLRLLRKMFWKKKGLIKGWAGLHNSMTSVGVVALHLRLTHGCMCCDTMVAVAEVMCDWGNRRRCSWNNASILSMHSQMNSCRMGREIEKKQSRKSDS